MTEKEFNEIVEEDGFDWALADLANTHDSIWTRDMLKAHIKYCVDNEDWFLVYHLVKYLDVFPEVMWFDYDDSMGTQDFPNPITDITCIEHLFDEEEEDVSERQDLC